MPRSFDLETQSPASVEQVQAAFTREDYWLDRLRSMDAALLLESLDIDADGAVSVRAVQRIGRQLLPGFVAALIPGELEFVHTETWRPADDRHVRGRVHVATSMGLGSGAADAVLAPEGAGSRLRFGARVEVKIPLVGRKLEKSIGTDLAGTLHAITSFTTAWISERG